MSSTGNNYDVLIVGGGVIGLSLAWELAQHDARVCVVDRGPLGQEASWAGAGMVPPGAQPSHWLNADSLEQLEGLSQSLHAEWHQKLLEQTGIDNEYERCGAMQLAMTADQANSLNDKVARWTALGINCQQLDAAAVADLEPSLSASSTDLADAYCFPDEAQIRNPRHLRALIAACKLAGVDLRPHTTIDDFQTKGNRVVRAESATATIEAHRFCLASGSWSGQLAKKLGIDLQVRPIRGQIVMLKGQRNLLRRNINVGPRYMVPRRDGYILIGSTQEDVGFEKGTTEEGIDGLRAFATALAPQTADLAVETSWSGLRPGTSDGLPYLGPVPDFDNFWLATGHFRAGLQLSTATAVVMRALMLGQTPPLEVEAFSCERA